MFRRDDYKAQTNSQPTVYVIGIGYVVDYIDCKRKYKKIVYISMY